jgi:hypothetical protein
MLLPPSLKVTVPLGVPLPVTVAVKVIELPEPEVKAVFGKPVTGEEGDNVVVVGEDAALNVTLMSQEEKVMPVVAKFGSAAMYRVQVPFTVSPVKTEAKVEEPFVAASEMVPVSPALL